jgi:lipopolysaccharide transport system permease protein
MNSQFTVIEAGSVERQYWRDIWRYRELLFFMAWRDILVRYKQTVVGVAWAVLKPLLTTFVFTFIFQGIAGMDSGPVPYALLVMAGMMPWNFFSVAVTESGNSLVSNAGMVSKVYFPRLIVPAASLLPSFVDLLISGVILAAMMAWYGVVPGWQIVFLPFFLLVAAGVAFGAGVWLSALMVRYRDVRFIIPFAVQLGFFVSGVAVASDQIPDKWRFWYSLNPMVGVIDGFRWALLGHGQSVYWPAFAVSIVSVVLLVILGIVYFRRTERGFADVI